MSAPPGTRLMTAEEYMAAELGDGCFELVRGEVVESSPPFSDHGFVCATLSALLMMYGRQTGLGYSLSNDSSVVTRRGPDSVRGPDVCFYSETRFPRANLGARFMTIAPDVTIEVVSPSNRKTELLEKVVEYLDAGSLAVWLVYPRERSVAIFRDSQSPPVIYEHGDSITDQPELPGFRCLVSELFP